MSEHLCKGVDMLAKGGAAFLLIASNTGHISVPLVRSRYPTLPILHIADTTASKIKAASMRNIGLLGTEPTMREEYLKQQLAKHAIKTLVPVSASGSYPILQVAAPRIALHKMLLGYRCSVSAACDAPRSLLHYCSRHQFISEPACYNAIML